MTKELLSRRSFLRGEFLSSFQSDTLKQQGFAGIRPPWSVDNEQFIAGCSRCGDCVSQCETNILIIGDGGFPEVKFSQGECSFCQRCVGVCQQPIFRPTTEQAWQHKIDITSNCLAQRLVECRTCQDYCETQAIRFKPQLGQPAKPNINLADCNGCGACLGACPVNAIKILFPQLMEGRV